MHEQSPRRSGIRRLECTLNCLAIPVDPSKEACALTLQKTGSVLAESLRAWLSHEHVLGGHTRRNDRAIFERAPNIPVNEVGEGTRLRKAGKSAQRLERER
jgi:hypothetical protein